MESLPFGQAPMPCPTCGGELRAGRLLGVPMGRCRTCHGSLVIQRDLVGLLGSLNARLSRVDLDAAIEPVPPIATPLGCPKCLRPMERFGYLGANQVQPHLCSDCGLLWVTGTELVTMWRLFARSERQGAVLDGELADIQTANFEQFVGSTHPEPRQSTAHMMNDALSLFEPASEALIALFGSCG